MTVVTGPPAGGKSTHIQENAQPGDVVVDFDALANALGAADPHDAPYDIKSVTFAARDAVIDRVLKGVSVDAWIIHTTPTPERMAQYKEAGAVFVEVDPGMDVVLAQAAADNRPEWTEQTIRDWYQAREGADDAMKSKSLEVQKRFTVAKLATADEDDTPGSFTAHVSAFGVLDYQGEIVDKGAYLNSIKKFGEGEKILLYWSHDYGDIKSLIGELTAIEETDEHLKIAGQLDVEDNDVAAKVYNHLLKGRLKEFSVGGMVDDWAIEGDDAASAFHIKALDLWEVSVCCKGANPETELLSVKSRALTAALANPKPIEDLIPVTPEPARLTKTTRALLGLLQLT